MDGADPYPGRSSIDVSDEEFCVYEHALFNEAWSTESVADSLDTSPEQVAEILHRLVRRGLFRSSLEGRRPIPVSPAVGLTPIATQAEQALMAHTLEVQRQNSRIAELARRFEQEQAKARGSFEVLPGVDTTVRRISELLRDANRVDTVVSSAPTARALSLARPSDEALVERARVRALYVASHVRRSRELEEYLDWLSCAGARIRLATVLPSRLMVIEGRAAVVAADPDDVTNGAMVVYSPGVVDLAATLFTLLWHGATPFRDGLARTAQRAATPADPAAYGSVGEGQETDQPRLASQPVAALHDMDRAVLRILAEGSKDDAVSRKLGISVRSVRRIVARISADLGVSSRFELGIRCRDLGLL